jgi:long-chain alkane monooxygenase
MFRLGLYTMIPVTHHSLATWKLPNNVTQDTSRYRFDRPAIWQHLGRVAERGRFDFIFAADVEGAFSEYGDSFRNAVRYATQIPCFDQTITMSFIGAATERIGIIPTLSINGTLPYVTARKIATLDHLSGGRAGWNVVTGYGKNVAANLGLEPWKAGLGHDQRYDLADEYIEICYRLWESWDVDAIVNDPSQDMFVEPDRVHEINFEGEYFSCKGPLNVHRVPQGRPVIAQAGQSRRGIEFAGAHAEVVFAIQPFREGMKNYHDRLKASAEQAGRDPGDVKIFFGFQPFVADTEEEAREKLDFHNSLVSREAGLTILSGHLAYDMGQLDPNGTVADLQVPGVQGLLDIYTRLTDGQKITVAQMGILHGRGVGCPQVAGTPAQIADWMESAIDDVGGDGFMLSPASIPSSVEEFVDKVVPVLQSRGLTRTDYPGTTFRDTLAAPANSLAGSPR